MNVQADKMRIATAVTTDLASPGLTERLARQIEAVLGKDSIELGVIFASAHFEDEFDGLVQALAERLPIGSFIGCTADAIMAQDREYEGQPAVALWAAHLPNTRVSSFHLSTEDLARLSAPADLCEHLRLTPGDNPSFLLLADPFSFSPTPSLLSLLHKLDDLFPGRPTIGGLASAGEKRGQNQLVFDGVTLRHGVMGVSLSGDVEIEPVVAQGCRPIGRHMVVTRADENIIYELGGKAPYEVVKSLLASVKPHEQRLLMRGGVLLGCAVDEHKEKFARGDFLIRNPIGIDADSGAMAVNDLIRTGQTVQFHIRDGAAASHDLEQLLEPLREHPATGALIFSCNGRGMNLFSHRHHDARSVSEAGGDLPAAGLFCAGEIGPIGHRSFLHSHTACVGFFRPAQTTINE